MEHLKFKHFDILETKATDKGALEISGYGAYFGNVDSYGDVIDKGAFINTLADRGDRIAFCYQHDIFNPIGKILQISEDEKGLFIKVRLSAAEKDIQTKIKEGILKEMSIGYSVVNASNEKRDERDVYVLKELKLYEVSLVTVAANPLAQIEGMKAEKQKDFINEEFDRLISIVRNDNIKYELIKLKSIVENSALAATPPQVPPSDEGLSKSEILKILQNG